MRVPCELTGWDSKGGERNPNGVLAQYQTLSRNDDELPWAVMRLHPNPTTTTQIPRPRVVARRAPAKTLYPVTLFQGLNSCYMGSEGSPAFGGSRET